MATLECYKNCPIKYPDGNRPCGYGIVMEPAGTNCRQNIEKAFAPDEILNMYAVTSTDNEVTVQGQQAQLGRVVSGHAIKGS